jgi:hypothetical protein
VGGVAGAGPAAAKTCDRYSFSTDPGRVTAAEFDQLREGMTLQQVQALFGSSGGVQSTSESSSSASTRILWLGNVSFVHWFDDTTDAEIEVTFSMDKATTSTSYKRKKVKVKNVKRAKRLGLPKWRWKSVKVVTQVPATPWTVDYFSVYAADVLRQQRAISCSSF